MVCFRYITVNTLHEGDNKDDNDDYADDGDNKIIIIIIIIKTAILGTSHRIRKVLLEA